MDINEIVELSFRGESVFTTIDTIVRSNQQDWFLETVLTHPMIKPDNPDKPNKIEIPEDKNTVMSIIETLRYNRLIVLPGVSLDYMYALADKWCLPEDILNLIKERIDKNIHVNKIKLGVYDEDPTFDLIDFIPLKCESCKAGFKMAENKPDSCVCHPGHYIVSDGVFSCCGLPGGSKPCTKGYHNLTAYDLRNFYIKYKKSINQDIETD